MISHHRIIYDRRRKAKKTTLLYIILLSFVLIYIIQATQKKHVHNTIGTDDAYPIGLSTKTLILMEVIRMEVPLALEETKLQVNAQMLRCQKTK